MVVLACGLGAMLALLLLGLALTRYAAELEEDLRAEQTERLSAAQRFMAFGQFAGAAVHDLNNMIVVLHSVAAELRVRDPVSPEVEDLEAATARAATVCREMLTFGRREEVLGAIDPGAVVQGLESLLRRTVTRSLVLEVLMPSEPLPVLAERGQLEMALLNLVANARDATKKGLVTVELARRSVTPDDWFGKQAVAAGSWVALSVRDTGTGMSAEVQANVFRPFFTTKGARGTGLGLAQVADFAQKSGGHVLIDSTPGRGTVVWVLLRAA
jgi:signal transduction histidine kinase